MNKRMTNESFLCKDGSSYYLNRDIILILKGKTFEK